MSALPIDRPGSPCVPTRAEEVGVVDPQKDVAAKLTSSELTDIPLMCIPETGRTLSFLLDAGHDALRGEVSLLSLLSNDDEAMLSSVGEGIFAQEASMEVTRLGVFGRGRASVVAS
jgi:hypothetical protein